MDKISIRTKKELEKIPGLLTGLAQSAIALAKDLLTTSEALSEEIKEIEAESE